MCNYVSHGAREASVIESDDTFWWAQLDDVAADRADKPSFHVFAEGRHSDVRGQVLNLDAGDSQNLPLRGLPHHFLIVLGIAGSVTAEVSGRQLEIGPLSQLVVLPDVPCRLTATTRASLELLSFLPETAHG